MNCTVNSVHKVQLTKNYKPQSALLSFSDLHFCFVDLVLGIIHVYEWKESEILLINTTGITSRIKVLIFCNLWTGHKFQSLFRSHFFVLVFCVLSSLSFCWFYNGHIPHKKSFKCKNIY